MNERKRNFITNKMKRLIIEGDTLDDKMRTLMFDKFTADKMLVVNNRFSIPIHSFVVSLRSSVLRRLINNNIYKYEIFLNDSDEESILQMIRFIYTDDIISEKYLVNLIILGHKYDIIFMSHYCEFLYHKLSKRKKIISLRYFCASRLILESSSSLSDQRIDYIVFANLMSSSILKDDVDLFNGLKTNNQYLYNHSDINTSNNSITNNTSNSIVYDSDDSIKKSNSNSNNEINTESNNIDINNDINDDINDINSDNNDGNSENNSSVNSIDYYMEMMFSS